MIDVIAQVGGTDDINKEDMKDWCWLNVGLMCVEWKYSHTVVVGRNGIRKYTFSFLREDDAMAFKIKFGI